MKKSGKLILIPTPIDETSPLESVALDLLKNAAESENFKQESIFAIEDLKPGRRRWLRFGLPRTTVEDFVLFNEHTQKELTPVLIDKMKAGVNVYLMSDGGLPAFCDPGQKLVSECHERGVTVTSTPFGNSISLSLALSGLPHDRFSFFGFLSLDKDKRASEWREVSERLKKETIILMDTPYRLDRLVDEAQKTLSGRSVKAFLGMNLGDKEQEKLVRAPLVKMTKILEEQGVNRPEFVLVLSESL